MATRNEFVRPFGILGASILHGLELGALRRQFLNDEMSEWGFPWNQKLSGLQVAVENAFGRWKGRFPILRNFLGYEIKEMYHLIEALLVVHNIVEGLGDDSYDISGFNGQDDPEVVQVHREMNPPRRQMLDADNLYRTGVARRKRLLEISQQI
jgi:hypothetical protein